MQRIGGHRNLGCGRNVRLYAPDTTTSHIARAATAITAMSAANSLPLVIPINSLLNP